VVTTLFTPLFTPPSRLGILAPQAVQKLGHMLPFNFYYYYRWQRICERIEMFEIGNEKAGHIFQGLEAGYVAVKYVRC